jgi:hypothetical protein
MHGACQPSPSWLPVVILPLLLLFSSMLSGQLCEHDGSCQAGVCCNSDLLGYQVVLACWYIVSCALLTWLSAWSAWLVLLLWFA